MVSIRRSPSSKPNDLLCPSEAQAGEGNRAWLQRHGDADGIILIGGTSVVDFRIRVAQSRLRHDLTPSSWSHCGILLKNGVFASVPLDWPDAALVPSRNGVQIRPLADYDNPALYPNVAAIRFARSHDDAIADIRRVEADRSLIDLPALMVPWLAFVWGAGNAANPLVTGQGVPGASFVETVFAMAGFDLTPGLSSVSSCPEAIWQAARWWNDYYEGAVADATGEGSAAGAPAAVPMVPTGSYVIRQKHAAIVERDEAAAAPPG
jgi:hypothetical protein